MQPTPICLSLLLLALVLPSAESAVAQDTRPAATKAEVKRKLASLTRELAIAEAKLERALRDVDDQAADDAAAAAKAAAELGFAKQKLANFDEREAPARLAKARLDAQGARDGMADSEEELAQLEMMYKGSEIADGTKDMVINRAKRSLQRANARLQLQEADLLTLQERTLPLERARIDLEVAERSRDAEKAKRAAEKAKFERNLATQAARHETARIADEIASAGRDA